MAELRAQHQCSSLLCASGTSGNSTDTQTLAFMNTDALSHSPYLALAPKCTNISIHLCHTHHTWHLHSHPSISLYLCHAHHVHLVTPQTHKRQHSSLSYPLYLPSETTTQTLAFIYSDRDGQTANPNSLKSGGL